MQSIWSHVISWSWKVSCYQYSSLKLLYILPASVDDSLQTVYCCCQPLWSTNIQYWFILCVLILIMLYSKIMIVAISYVHRLCTRRILSLLVIMINVYSWYKVMRLDVHCAITDVANIMSINNACAVYYRSLSWSISSFIDILQQTMWLDVHTTLLAIANVHRRSCYRCCQCQSLIVLLSILIMIRCSVFMLCDLMFIMYCIQYAIMDIANITFIDNVCCRYELSWSISKFDASSAICLTFIA